MIKAGLVGASVFIVLTALGPASAESSERLLPVQSKASSAPVPPADDCEARIDKLESSNAEGEERLAEKNEVIDFCAGQYKQDRTINRLVDACAKYEEQPVIKQQFVAECQIAAFKYANALRALKMDYGK